MMKHNVFLSLTLLLSAGLFSTAVCSAPTSTKAVKVEKQTIAEPAKVEPDPPGLIKTDVKPGEGELATAGKGISVHYTGWLYDETAADHHGKKFDSSRDRGYPFDFPLGAGHVIKGWDIGLLGMKAGGQRTLIVPPSLGYGEIGAGNGVIPPNATLIFDIELISVDARAEGVGAE